MSIERSIAIAIGVVLATVTLATGCDELMSKDGLLAEVIQEAGDLAALPQDGFRPGPPDGQEPPEDPLGLTEEQREQARTIFDAVGEDIRVLREAAHDQVVALLTDEQLVLLEELEAEQGPPPRPHHPPYCGTATPPEQPEGESLPPHMADLAEALALTDEQLTQFIAIHDETRAAVEARKDEACTEFRAILTDEQLAMLDEMPPPPPPHGGRGGPGGPDGPGGHGEPDRQIPR